MTSMIINISDNYYDKFIDLIRVIPKDDIEIEYREPTKQEILDGLREAIEDVKAGRTYPIESLWNDIWFWIILLSLKKI